MFWSLVLEIRKHALWWITICMIYHRSCIDTIFEKQKHWHHEQANIFMHHTSSTIVFLKESIYKNRLKISQIEDHLQRPIYPLNPVSYCPSNPVLSGPSSPVLSGPPSPISYWPTKPNFVLATKPSFVWPTKPSSVLAHQAQFCLAHQAQFRTGPPSPVSY